MHVHIKGGATGCRTATGGRKKKYDLTKEEGWDKLRAHVTGEIGIQDYDALTLRETMLIIEGYQERILQGYRQTRLLMFMMVRLWGDPKKAPDHPEDLWRLPGEEDQRMSEADIAAIFAKLRAKEGSG